MELNVGSALSIALSEKRQCIGYYDFVQKQRFVCSAQRQLKEQYVQCFACQRREVTYYTFTGYGADPEAAEAYLETQAHQAYLALFGNDLLKVGVASEGRRLRRTLEQGAVACLFFALANGNRIRELERTISRGLNIRERITSLQKIKRLVAAPSVEPARTTLHNVVVEIEHYLDPQLRQHLLPEAQFYFLQDKYRLQLPEHIHALKFIKRATPLDTYSGIVRGVAGGLLILEAQDEQLYVLPMKGLQGVMATIAADIQEMRVQVPPQNVVLERIM
jgi:hypothetical protein